MKFFIRRKAIVKKFAEEIERLNNEASELLYKDIDEADYIYEKSNTLSDFAYELGIYNDVLAEVTNILN